MRRHLKKARLLLAALAVGIFIAAALAVPRDYYAGPLQRLTQTEASSYGSIDNRLDIWRATAAMIEEHPWRGTGIGTFFLYYPAHRPQTDVSSSGLMAHSDPLQFWQEAGIAAPLLFYAFLLLAGWRMISALRFIAPDNPQRPMIAALFCGLAALIAHSHADFSLNMAPLLLLAGLMLGRWFGLTGVHPDVEIALPRRWPAAAQWSVVAAPFLLAAVFAQGFFRSEYYAGRAQELALSGDVAAFAAAVNISDKAGFGLNARAYMMAATLPLGMLQNGASSLSPAEKAAQEAQAEKMLDLAQAHNPRLSPVYFYRAQLEDAAGDKAVAKAQLERGLAINPLHQPSRVMLAGLLLGEGAEDEAYAVLLAGLHWPPRFQDPTPYYDMVMMLADKRGDKETAALVAAKAADYAQRQKTRPTFPQQY